MNFNKIILSDVDGVILNFNSSFVRYVNKRYNKQYTPDQVIFYDYKMSLGLSNKQFTRVYNEFIDSEKIEKLRYFIGVVDFYKYFHRKGFIIKLVTAIEGRSEEKRIKNLSKLEYRDITFDDFNNSSRIEILKEFKPMYIFEDRPKYIFNCLKNKQYFKFLFIPIRPYNEKYIKKWIKHEQVFVYDNHKNLLKKFKLLEDIYETKKTS